ncbi:MAG: M56 family metallopeptidase [Bacteroidota bacterium]
MEQFLTYLVRSSLIVTVVFLLYQLLKNDSNFKRNRMFLLAGIIASIVLPLVGLLPSASMPLQGSVLLDPVVVNAEGIAKVVQGNYNVFGLLMIVYVGGVVVLLVRDGWQLLRLYRLAKLSRMVKTGDYKLVKTREDGSPFSFFNFIFINENILKSDVETILAHERVHAQQRHSIDVLLMELFAIVLWFNPVVWLYRNSLREVHEYLADNGILQQGIEKAGYLQLLCAMALRVDRADITNKFCQIKLKRRLTMITKRKNSRLSGLKFVAVLPVLLMFLWLIACNNSGKDAAQNLADSVATQKGKDSLSARNEVPPAKDAEVFTVVENMPEYVGGNAAMGKFMADHITYPQKAKESGLQGTVYVSFVVGADGAVGEAKVLRGIGGGCDEEALRVVKLMPKWKPGKQNGSQVSVLFNLPVKFSLN